MKARIIADRPPNRTPAPRPGAIRRDTLSLADALLAPEAERLVHRTVGKVE